MSNDRMEKNVTIFASFFEKNNPRGKNPRGLKEQDWLYGLPEAVRMAFDFEVFVFEEFGDTELAVEVVPFFVGLDADLMLFDVGVAIEDHAEVLVALVLVADEALFGGDVIRGEACVVEIAGMFGGGAVRRVRVGHGFGLGVEVVKGLLLGGAAEEDFRGLEVVIVAAEVEAAGVVGFAPVNIVAAGLAGEAAAVVACVHLHGEADLFEVVGAVRLVGGFAGFAEGRHEHGGEDGDDADDDEQFD